MHVAASARNSVCVLDTRFTGTLDRFHRRAGARASVENGYLRELLR